MRRHLVLAFSALVPLVLAAPARAADFEVSAGSAMHIFRSATLDAASGSDTVTMGDLAAGYKLTPYAPILGTVYVEGRYMGGGVSAVDFDLYDVSLSFQTVQLGVHAVREVWPRVHVGLRFGAGATRGALRITNQYDLSGDSLADADWAPSWSAGASSELSLLESKSTGRAFGLRLELGWHDTGELAFKAHPEHADPDAAHIDALAAPLGSVDASGLVVRVGLFGRF